MIFPTGKLDPDPACLPGAAEALAEWSDSLEIFLRRAPETIVIPTIVSGVFAPSTLRNPLTKLRKEFWMQQRIAEYIQVVQMMFFNKKYGLKPKVTFGEPLSVADTDVEEDRGAWMPVLIQNAQAVLDEHTAQKVCPPDAPK